MRPVRAFLIRIAAVWRGGRLDSEFADELASHLQLHIDDNLRAGMTPEQARRRAIMALGGIAQTQEHHRERSRYAAVDRLVQDLRFGIRGWKRNAAFAATSVLVLAVGLSAIILIFGAANEFLLKPLAVPEADRVVRIYSNRYSNTPYADYLAYRDRTRTLAGLGISSLVSVSLRTTGDPLHVMGMAVSGNYFDTLDVRAARGRALNPADDDPGAPGVALISHTAWRQRFAADADIVGRRVVINGAPFTIVGVLPDAFRGEMAPILPEVWVPWNATGFAAIPGAGEARGRRERSGPMIGRLAPGATLQQVEAEFAGLAVRLRTDVELPNGQERTLISVYPALRLVPELGGNVTLFFGLLLALVMIVLATACLNLANLMLARWTARRREMAVRLALGASRRRIIQQLLAECFLIASAGTALGLILAFGAAGAVSRASVATPVGPVGLNITFDWRVVAFAAVAMIATTFGFGLLPALRSSADAVQAGLKDADGRVGPRRTKLGTVLVTGQIALATLLLIVAAVLTRSMLAATATDRGFAAGHVLTASMDLSVREYSPERGLALYRELTERLSQIPGITNVNLVDIVPLTLSNQSGFVVRQGDPLPDDATPPQQVYINAVSPGHFRTLAIRQLAGRDFTRDDAPDTQPVAIVNETLARLLWPGQTAVGRRVQFVRSRTALGNPVEVVGVVQDSKYVTVGEDPRPFLYRPLSQSYTPRVTLLVKTAAEPMAVLPAVRAEVRRTDPDLPLFNAASLETATNVSLLPIQIVSLLSIAVGFIAFGLSTTGVYAVVSYLIRRRTREIGIRLALGATRRDIVRLMSRQGRRWAGIGLALGLVAALGVTQLLRALLYGIPPADIIAFGSVSLLLAATTSLACWIPARRSARIDPLTCLRDE